MPNERSSFDEQVVKMTFDNSNFDQNINDSIQALNRLDDKLGLLNKEDFSGIKNNLAELAQTFTVKGQIMFGVFARLGSEVVNLGIKFKNKLLGGLKDGLNEYNQIIDATQTIFANVKQSGASIDDVNNALDELNEYADLTIYNFGQMTRMIGMFTSAGVGLKKSVNTIKGLANAAALVGATPERAQIAWNAVARAMSSGTFSNLTWKSLELSNIAGKQFNDLITEVARANKVTGSSGKNIDQMLKKYGTLRETLREKWLTKDVFNEAMQIMAGELSKEQMIEKGYTEAAAERLRQIADAATEAATEVKTFKQLVETTGEAIGSGWAQSFRILIGDLNVAKKMFTRISYVVSDFIDNNARIRNDLFTKIVEEQDKGVLKDLKTGRESFTQIIENMLAVFKTFLKAVKTGFLNIFPVERIAVAARKVLDIVEKFTRALVLNQEQLNGEEVLGWDTKNIDKVSDAIKNLIKFFRGLASAADIAWMAISQPIKVIVDRIPFFKNFFNNTNSGLVGILKRLGQFGDKITIFRDAVKDTQIFGTVLALIIDNIDELGEEYPVLGAILGVFRGLRNAVTKVSDAFKRLNIKPLNVLLGAFKMIVTSISKVLNFIFGLLRDAKNRINWSWLDKPKQVIVDFLKKLNDYGQGLTTFEETLRKISESIGKTFGKIAHTLNKILNSFRYKTGHGEITKTYSNLNTTAKNTEAILTNIWTKIKNIVAPIGEFFSKVFNKSNFTLDNIEKKIALIGAGVGAAALTVGHLIKTVQRVKILSNFNELLEAGIDVVKAYQKEMNSKAILNVAAAIGILAASLAVLSFIPYNNLENGLIVFTGFMTVLSMTLTPIITSIARFNESLNTFKTTLTGMDVLNNFVNQLGMFGQKIASSIGTKMMGEMFKDLATSIFILTGAIAALVLLFKLDGDNTVRAIENISNMILIMVGAVGILAGSITALSKIGDQSKKAINSFTTFFSLAGLATVIMSIAAAMMILVGAMAAMSKINTTGLEDNFKYFRETLIWVGGIAAVLTGLIAGLGAIGKSNGPRFVLGVSSIVIAITASVIAMSLALKKLAEADPKNLRKVFKYIKEFLVTIGVFASIITLLSSIAQMFGSFGNNSVKVILAMMVSVTAVVAAMHLLGKAEPIDPSVVETLQLLVVALGIVSAVVVAIGAVVSRANSTFSTSFSSVFSKVAISIAAVIASIGVMTAGIAALFASLSSMSVSDSETNRAANSIIIRLNIIAETIRKSIPALRQTFYSLGQYAGSLFTAFTFGFINNIISTGDVYNEMAVKAVNLIIDILGKVINTLHQRRNEIKTIIRQAIDIIAGVITEVINDVFYKDNVFKVKEDDILKLLGFTGLTVGGGSLILKLASNFNTLATSAKNLKLAEAFKPLSNAVGNLRAANELLKEAKKSGKEIDIAKGFVSEERKNVAKAAADMAAIAVAAYAIKTGLESISIGLAQLSGEQARYIRSDIDQMEDGWEKFGATIKAVFTDADFRKQSFVDGLMLAGEAIVSTFMYFAYKGASFFLDLSVKLGKFISSMISPLLNGLAVLDPNNSDKYKNFEKDFVGYFERLEEESKKYSEKADWGMQTIGSFMNTDNVIDGAQKTVDAVEEAGEAVSNAYYDVGAQASQSFTDGLNSTNGWDAAKNWLTNTFGPGVISFFGSALAPLGLGLNETVAQTADDIYNSFKVTDLAGNEKAVAINKEYLEIINEEQAALKNLGREEQIRWIKQKAAAKGIEVDEKALAQTYAAILLNQEQQAYVTADGIQKVQEQLNSGLASVEEQMLGTQVSATNAYMKDFMNSTLTMTEIAEENKDKLVGMKADEAAEFLAIEAQKRGLTEEEAKEAAKALLAINEAEGASAVELTEDEILKKIRLYGDEYKAFQELEQKKTEYAAKMTDLRVQMAKTEYVNSQEALAKGSVNGVSAYELAKRNFNSGAQKEFNDLQNEYYRLQKEYNKAVNEQMAMVQKGYGLESGAADKFNKKVSEYGTAISDAKKAQGSVGNTITTTIKQFLDKVKNGVAGDVDLKPWDYTVDKKPSDLKDLDTKSAVDTAADLKNDLEANRADLTPVFDLDKLESDANKANGIVMSSLMAAQNASIGDYINKDSELNPFMKDRWQNVYNFTQNNYSPKALSRIDIYRQTQRQISMSRGF